MAALRRLGMEDCLLAALTKSMHWLTWVGFGVRGQSHDTRGDAAGVVMAVWSEAVETSLAEEKLELAEKAEDAEPDLRLRALVELRRE